LKAFADVPSQYMKQHLVIFVYVPYKDEAADLEYLLLWAIVPNTGGKGEMHR